MIAAAGDELGGFGVLLLGLLILVVASLWMVFPILVLIKFNDLLKAQRAIHRATKCVREIVGAAPVHRDAARCACIAGARLEHAKTRLCAMHARHYSCAYCRPTCGYGWRSGGCSEA